VSSGAEVVAPGIGLPEGGDTERENLWQRAIGNVRSGNLGVLPVVLAELGIVTYFAFTATNFFTAPNFVNVILQMAGTTMIAYGVVFVLLLGEIDLSIGYVSGICAVAVAEFQLAGSAHDFPGWLAILFGLGIVALIGLAQGTIVAKVGVPSFVVTLAGLLIFQGVILKILQSRDTILIDDNWINDTATYYFSANVGWLIAAVITGGYVLVAVLGILGQRRAGLSANVGIAVLKLAGVAIATFGTVAICNHAQKPAACPEGTPLTENCYQPLGLPLAGLLMLIFLVGLKNVPEALYEAARLDGASSFQAFRHIAVPLLKPVMLYVSVITLISSYNIYAQAFVLASDVQGAPGRLVRVLVLDMLENSFRNYRVGYAAAEAVVLLVIVLILTSAQFRLFRDRSRA